jgi:hypothetical protein
MQMRALLILLAIGSTTAASSQMRIVWDTQNGPVRTRGVVSNLDLTHFRKEALRLLSPHKVRIGRFVSYGSAKDRFKLEGQGGTDCSYDSWRSEIEARNLARTPVQCPEAAEALKIEHAILMRTIDSKCQLTQVVTNGGADPMRVLLAGTRYEIVSVTIQPLDKDQSSRSDLFSPVHFFVRTDDEVTKERAKRFLVYMREKTTTSDISVILRGDSWFAMHCDFPFWFLTPPVPVPTKVEFLKSSEAVCVALKQWPINCY